MGERRVARLAMRLAVAFFVGAVLYAAFDARRGYRDCARICESEGSSSFIYVPASPDTGRAEECVCRAP